MFDLTTKLKSAVALVCAILMTLFAYPAFAGQASLAWNASASTGVTGYKVHYGTASGSYGTHLDVGNTLSTTIPNLTSGATYYFAVTAYNAAGESSYSNEASATIPVAAPVAAFNASTLSGPAPLATTFSSTSTGSISSTSWNFGDGTTGTGASVSKTYNTAGSYTVTLTVTGSGGTNSTTRTVTVSSPVVGTTADFSSPSASGTAPLTVAFVGTASSGLTSFAWDFGDGSVGSGSSVSHVYTTPGNYTVTLTASGTAGSKTVTKADYVQVGNALSAAFTANRVSGTVPLRVKFSDDSSGTINAYLWTFGDGTTSTDAEPVHMYRRPGSYSVSLTVTGPSGTKTQTRSAYVSAVAANDLVATFGTGGTWMMKNGTTWSRLDTRNARQVAMADPDGDGKSDLIIDLGTDSLGKSLGIWRLSKTGVWSVLDARSAKNMVVGDVDGNGKDDIVFDFGSAGLWLYANGSTWRQIDNRTTKRMLFVDLNRDARDELIVDFGAGSGVWGYTSDGAWTQVDTRSPVWMVAADLDGNDQMDLVGDFGIGGDTFGSPTGIWALINGSSWTQISPKSALAAIAVNPDGGRKDNLILHFSGFGLVQYSHSAAVGVQITDHVLTDWKQIGQKAVTRMVAADLNADGKQEVIADFGAGTGNGQWKFAGGLWSQISRQTTTGLISGQYK